MKIKDYHVWTSIIWYYNFYVKNTTDDFVKPSITSAYDVLNIASTIGRSSNNNKDSNDGKGNSNSNSNQDQGKTSNTLLEQRLKSIVRQALSNDNR